MAVSALGRAGVCFNQSFYYFTECAFSSQVYVAGVSFEQYNATFGQYLNAALHDAGDCSLNTIPLHSVLALSAGFQEGTLDFSFVDPSTFACLAVS